MSAVCAEGLARAWACAGRALDLGRTRLMGVINVTPDSFSDGGAHDGVSQAVAWGMRLLDEGADILDVGGESTRPGFVAVDPAEEMARVLPVVRELADAGALVSIDTRHAEVARAALEAGAGIVNDVSGFADPAMLAVVAEGDCGCVAMHAMPGALGEAVTDEPAQGPDELVARVERFLLDRAAALEAAGVDRSRICIDPGPGFGTDARQDVAVQRATGRLARLGFPYLCAVSRKRFVGALSGVANAPERDSASVGVALAAVAAGARVLRVHNVAATAQALRTFEACAGLAPCRRALVALGANLGDREASLRDAVDRLGELPLTRVAAASHIYDTEAAYLDGQPSFANAVVELETGLHPRALLEALLSIEAAAGRVRTIANGPRPLDLDLLWMEGEHHAGARLTLPHPRLGERSFVLRPLADVVGDVAAFCGREGISLVPEAQRVGRVTEDLGGLL